MRRILLLGLFGSVILLDGCRQEERLILKMMDEVEAPVDCAAFLDNLVLHRDIRRIGDERDERFIGKVQEATARCFGGQKAVDFRNMPYVDWQNYWATGDAGSKAGLYAELTHPLNGVNGALLDLEYQRMGLVRFNLFDNAGTYEAYVSGDDEGKKLSRWPQMRLPDTHPHYEDVGGEEEQLCQSDLIRFRNVDGLCNDIKNPLMGSTRMPFARNVALDETFPRLGKTELVRNRHGDRLGLLKPDPQTISRKLFTRTQPSERACETGGLGDDCDYTKAPFFNVLAAFWIQFMNHDWFSHLEEGHNQAEMMKVGCAPEDAARLGCRPGDTIDKAFVAEDTDPESFVHLGKEYPTRAYRTTENTVTAWWDASQIYGFDETSRKRVKRDPEDRARLAVAKLGDREGAGEQQGYLPLLDASDPMNPAWAGQGATAFPDNWTVGLSFFHTVFTREHNKFVEVFREQTIRTPDADCGLRHPDRAQQVITYADVTDDELFEVARLVVAAEIAKIHTLEWTTQLLYDEPLYRAMNSNWNGFFAEHPAMNEVMGMIVNRIVSQSEQKDSTLLSRASSYVSGLFTTPEDGALSNEWYSAFASGPGILGLGSHRYEGELGGVFGDYDPNKEDLWSLTNPDDVNGGVNHFGSPFNFPEEFVTVYRLHPLLPDLLEYREWNEDPNVIRDKVPVVKTFRGKATEAMRQGGLANWALSMGRQRLGALTLQNHPHFLQNLHMPSRLAGTETQTIDVAALDLIRDRERGVPRFNEFRRQYGLKSFTSFDDFIDLRADESTKERQRRVVEALREVYGQHPCDASKVITEAQRFVDLDQSPNGKGVPINDCLGHPDGTIVDNIEDVDTVVGWLAEFPRPHGFAISETQFQVFILNASRRLFSDRFFTSSFRPEFYTTMGLDWVKFNGPDGKLMEKDPSNDHEIEVSPLKRVLLRTIPELRPELEQVVNVFDPWARDRGDYYSLEWKPRPGAETDEAFAVSRN